LADTQAVEGSRAAARSQVEAGTAALADIGNTVVVAGMDTVVHTAAAHIAIDMAALLPVAGEACTPVVLLGCPRSAGSRNSSRTLCLAALAARNLDRMFPDWRRELLPESRIAGKISCR